MPKTEPRHRLTSEPPWRLWRGAASAMYVDARGIPEHTVRAGVRKVLVLLAEHTGAMEALAETVIEHQDDACLTHAELGREALEAAVEAIRR